MIIEFQIICIFLLLALILLPITALIIIKKIQDNNLAGFFDKIGTGIISGVFVSALINSLKILQDILFATIHLSLFIIAATFLVWGISLKK